MPFCDKCWTKVIKLVRNFVALKKATQDPNVITYIDAKAALDSSLRKSLKK